jgi:penicillin-binding protein 1B
MSPFWVNMVRDGDGAVLEQTKPRGIPVLDPRIAFLMTDLMQGVIQRGTGVGVRARGFTAPAAGKTGTSHDGWFAGYTSNLLAIVWVGYDDNTELPLSGASSALPIWTEFMKRAVSLPQYSRVEAPVPPPGVVRVSIDADTGEIATPHCTRTESYYFLEGTQPAEYCHVHYLQPLIRRIPVVGAIANAISPPAEGPEAPQASAPAPAAPPAAQAATAPPAPEAAAPAEPPQQRRRGIFGRIFGIFTGGDSDEENEPADQPQRQQ